MMDFLEEIGWSYDRVSEPVDALVFDFEEPDVGGWACYALPREEQQICLFYSECPIQTPQDRWPAVSEFLMQANYGMPIGNFEMNPETGEIRFKTGIDVEGDRLSKALFKGIVKANVEMMAEYLPGIIMVGLEGYSPEAAIQEIESGELSSSDSGSVP
ncbi:MAG: YbjN domain-containing protein [Roseofilum sp. SID1]|nr:YbjN domain-containing protein [Roseofilum sp. SID2]MBP0037028.1 YbjN domain-containing protein [Roseofilum sp. SID1]